MIIKETINNNKTTLLPSYYSLTTKGKKIDKLKVTGADYEDNRSKKKKLYMLLLCFELFKRGRILSERQFPNFLKQYDSSIDKLEKINDKNINQESTLNISIFNKDVTFYKTFNGIQIIKFKNANDEKYYYYTVIPGFSAEEFKFYIELIKKGKEPHPFSEDRTSIEIPIISYLNFSMEEIEDAINLLRQNDIIKPIKSVIAGEMRYGIKNDDLQTIFIFLWHLHIIDFYMVMNRLIDCNTFLENDLKFLIFYYGQKKAGKMLAYLYDYKRKYKKNKIDKSIDFEYLKDFEEQRKVLVNMIESLYKKTVQKMRIIL